VDEMTTARPVDAEELALSRAIIFRLLSLACAYPTAEVRRSLRELVPAARVAGELASPAVRRAVDTLCDAVARSGDEALERGYIEVFTATSSPTCPAHETAYTAKHLFQVSEQMADVAGFYRAFSVEPDGERVDQLATELEFAYLLALKEAYAREHGTAAQLRIVRSAEGAFLRDHLGRWAAAAGERMTAEARDGSVIGAAGVLLVVFVAGERARLRAGASAPLPARPYAPPEPGEDDAACMAQQQPAVQR